MKQEIKRAAAGGVLVVLVATSAPGAVRYVSAFNASPSPPFLDWATAAATIQEAIDVANPGDEIVVTNGVYATGGRAVDGLLTNRVAVTKPVTVRSVNGPLVTIIQGDQAPGATNGFGAVRCVYLTNRAQLVGFTLTNGAAHGSADNYREEGGGGVFCESTNAEVSNCVLTGNSAARFGGGTFGGRVSNCAVTGNSAGSSGGGAFGSVMNNCSITGNSADGAGGVDEGELNNCIVYYNTARSHANFSRSMLNRCCTAPLPVGGTGNITVEPQIASASHLSASSPCRAAGSTVGVSGTDIDGEAWASPPSIGCDEYRPGDVTGPLAVSVRARSTNIVVGLTVEFVAGIDGRTSASRWDFGDGTVSSNRPYAAHAWLVTGQYPVVLTAFNESNPGGISATVTVQIVAQPVLYVAADSLTPLAPYDAWASAATTIQDAVDVAVPGSLIIVTNGLYATGGRAVDGLLTNRVAITKPVTVRSVNGPAVTIIRGEQAPGATNGDAAVRCAYLTNGAQLAGFTLTNGATRVVGRAPLEDYGGGVWCESGNATVSNCILVGNSASGFGGGAYQGVLHNCIVARNSARSLAGGAYGSTLANCTLTGNSAGSSPGVHRGTLYNCIVYDNLSQGLGPNHSASTLNYCSTQPLPTDGVGNITNAPLFIDAVGGNLRLKANSPCINAGNNAYVTADADLDGNARISGGTVDIGAYEFQNPASSISYAWLQEFGLPMDGSADQADPDADLLSNWAEWQCGTDPTNALSVLRLLTPERVDDNLVLRWESVVDRTYFVQRCTNLAAALQFTTVASNLPGQPVWTSYTDTNAAATTRSFYRVGVAAP